MSSSTGIVTPPPNEPPANVEFLYSYLSPSGEVQGSVIDTSTGALSTPVSAGLDSGFVNGLIANPAANVIYVLGLTGGDTGNVEIQAYSVSDSAGALTQISLGAAASPTNALGSFGDPMSIDPKGRFLYVLEGPDGVSDGVINTIQEFTLDAQGLPASASDVQSANSMTALAIDPLSRFLYAGSATLAGAGIRVYMLDATSGAPTEVTGSPFSIVFDADSCQVNEIWPDPTGKFVYAGFSQSGPCAESGIIAFSVNAATGALTLVPGSPFALGSEFSSAVFGLGGKFLYVAGDSESGSNVISVFAIDPSMGTLTLQSGLSLAVVEVSLDSMIDSSGQFLYFSEGSQTPNGSTLSGCRIDATTGALTRVTSVPVMTNEQLFFPLIMKTH